MWGALFKTVGILGSKIPNASERAKKRLKDETEKYFVFKEAFENMAVSFGVGSRSDELLGLADKVRIQGEYLSSIMVIFASDIESGGNGEKIL